MKTYKIEFMRMDCGKIKADSESEALTKYMSNRGLFKREGYLVTEIKR